LNRIGIFATGVVTATLIAFALAYAALVATVGTGPLPAFAYGNGDGTSSTTTVIGTPVPFSLNYSAQLKGGYVSAGDGMRASGPPGNGSITLPGVPAGSTITKAYLYWSVINSTMTPALGMGTLNGNAVSGTNYATTASPCWDSPVPRQIYSFVADVTADAVFGVNALTGFASGGPPTFPPTEPLLEGASLIVVYSNPASQNHQVDIYHGARSFIGPPVETLTMSGFTAVAGSSQTTWVVADGQPNSPPFNNKTRVDGVVTQSPALNGADGDFWDTNTQDVTANIPPADTSITVGAESSFDLGAGDCITWVAQALSVPVQEPPPPTPAPTPGPVGGLVDLPVTPTGAGSNGAGTALLAILLTSAAVVASGGAALSLARRRS
jgi:hypothetical protein